MLGAELSPPLLSRFVQNASLSLREEKEVSLLAGAEKICSGFEFRLENSIFVATGPGPSSQIEMTSLLTSSSEGSNSNYAIKPKNQKQDKETPKHIETHGR